jgi:hypothetical protein
MKFQAMMTGAGLACALMMTACTVHESGSGEKKNVDIKTPMGSMSVRSDKDADPKQTGITPYPGATQVADEEGEKNANVNMSFGGFGLKVAAAHYRSDDSPEKVMDFYKKELAKYGTVLVCDAKARRETPDEGKDSDVLTCGERHGQHGMNINPGDKDDTELKVGTQHRQHIVAIKPKGSGTGFALVYVELHGGKEATM